VSKTPIAPMRHCLRLMITPEAQQTAGSQYQADRRGRAGRDTTD
jgi:hypothetical protein